jgi:hypothetical protein
MVARDPELETTIVITTSAQRVVSVLISTSCFMADAIKDGVGVERRADGRKYSGLHNKKGYCSPGKKKTYVDHYLSCCWFGEEPPCQPLTRPHLLLYHLHISKRTAHHDGQRLWLISLPVALPPPIRFVPLHPHTVGDTPQPWFCRN